MNQVLPPDELEKIIVQLSIQNFERQYLNDALLILLLLKSLRLELQIYFYSCNNIFLSYKTNKLY